MADGASDERRADRNAAPNPHTDTLYNAYTGRYSLSNGHAGSYTHTNRHSAPSDGHACADSDSNSDHAAAHRRIRLQRASLAA